MSVYQDIIGHEAVKKALMHAANAPQNGYLFSCPSGVGGHLLAEKFVRVLVEHVNERPLTAHPDIVVLRREMNDAGTALKKELSIKAVRELRSRISGRPSIAKRTVIYIPEADRLNEEGVNALLKSVEEPPAGAVFIFVTHAPFRIPATLLSRLVQIQLGLIPENELREWLKEKQYTNIDNLLEIAQGRPGYALRYEQDSDFRSSVHEASFEIKKLLDAKQLGNAFAAIGSRSAKIEKQEDSVTEWRNAIQLWQGALRREIQTHPVRAEKFGRAFIQAERAIGSSVSPRIILERAFTESGFFQE